MKLFIYFVLMWLASQLMGQQTNFEQDMKAVWETTTEQDSAQYLENLSKKFGKVAENYPSKWLPKYYQILYRTFDAFGKPADQAFDELVVLDSLYNQLTTQQTNDEIVILKGLMLTVKVSKDPMQYGMSLSPQILKIYTQSLSMNAQNPRALYLMAEYEMNAAPYFGKSPSEYCNKLTTALANFEKENEQETIAPHWGQDSAMALHDKYCNQ